MILRKRDRIEMVLWAILVLYSVAGVVLAELRLDSARELLEKCPNAQTQR